MSFKQNASPRAIEKAVKARFKTLSPAIIPSFYYSFAIVCAKAVLSLNNNPAAVDATLDALNKHMLGQPGGPGRLLWNVKDVLQKQMNASIPGSAAQHAVSAAYATYATAVHSIVANVQSPPFGPCNPGIEIYNTYSSAASAAYEAKLAIKKSKQYKLDFNVDELTDILLSSLRSNVLTFDVDLENPYTKKAIERALK